MDWKTHAYWHGFIWITTICGGTTRSKFLYFMQIAWEKHEDISQQWNNSCCTFAFKSIGLREKIICSMTPSADTHYNSFIYSLSVSHSLSRKWFDVLIFNCLVKVDSCSSSFSCCCCCYSLYASKNHQTNLSTLDSINSYVWTK